MSFKVLIVVLLLWWALSTSSASAAATKKTSGDVSIGDYSVDFNAIDGQWNPYYVKKSSVDFESTADPPFTSSEPSEAMRDLIDESSVQIKNYDLRV
jgi:hypothetical protein